MPLIAKRGLGGAFDRGLDIGFFVHDDGILAAHFEHGTLDPDLAGHRLARQLTNMQADFL